MSSERNESLLVLNAAQVRAAVSMPALIRCLDDAFRNEFSLPTRQISEVPGGTGGRLVVCMPAFDRDGGGAIKFATVFPDNKNIGLPTVQAVVVVFSASGTPVALLDGTVLTQLRTAAASALASSYLSRADSSQLVIIGTGALAPTMAAAHCVARPITQVNIWGRKIERAQATVAAVRTLVGKHVKVAVCSSLEVDVAKADIVSCSTSSPTPVLLGKWLRPGAFVDLVGSFSPATREADDDVVSRARIFVDTLAGAMAEAGDILDPIKRGTIERCRIEGELADLACKRVAGRKNQTEIIVFKSVGTAIEDLAAAQMITANALDAYTQPGVA